MAPFNCQVTSLVTWNFQSLPEGEVRSTEANTAEVPWGKSLDGQSDTQFWWIGYRNGRLPKTASFTMWPRIEGQYSCNSGVYCGCPMEESEQHWPFLEDMSSIQFVKVYSNATKALWGQDQSYFSSCIQPCTFVALECQSCLHPCLQTLGFLPM